MANVNPFVQGIEDRRATNDSKQPVGNDSFELVADILDTSLDHLKGGYNVGIRNGYAEIILVTNRHLLPALAPVQQST